MSRIYLPWNASKARLRDAEHTRRNRAEIVRELSWGRITRRDLFKWGLLTGAGMLAPIGGLNPFVASAKAAALGPTGAPPSPRYGCDKFTQPMVRFDVMARNPVSFMIFTISAMRSARFLPTSRGMRSADIFTPRSYM